MKRDHFAMTEPMYWLGSPKISPLTQLAQQVEDAAAMREGLTKFTGHTPPLELMPLSPEPGDFLPPKVKDWCENDWEAWFEMGRMSEQMRANLKDDLRDDEIDAPRGLFGLSERATVWWSYLLFLATIALGIGSLAYSHYITGMP